MKNSSNKSNKGRVLFWIGIVIILISIFVGAYPKIVSTIGVTSDFLGSWPSETVVTVVIALVGIILLIAALARSLATRYGK